LSAAAIAAAAAGATPTGQPRLLVASRLLVLPYTARAATPSTLQLLLVGCASHSTCHQHILPT
jgi:hypothetical protein